MPCPRLLLWLLLLLPQVIRIQPNEAIYLKVNNKVPGLGLRIDISRLDLSYKSKYNTQLPGAALVCVRVVCMCACVCKCDVCASACGAGEGAGWSLGREGEEAKVSLTAEAGGHPAPEPGQAALPGSYPISSLRCIDREASTHALLASHYSLLTLPATCAALPCMLQTRTSA